MQLAVDYTTIKNHRKITYINLPCGFDIETTSAIVDNRKTAFMYVWMLGIGHNTGIIKGNTWESFKSTCAELTEHFQLGEDRLLPIYVHNLGYEFQFMRKHFEWDSVFAVGDRKPIRAVTKCGIEFRCSYILSGYSLANTAKNLTHHKVAKKEGDLDYSLIRHQNTPLTESEVGYCDNDIHIVTAYIQEQIDYYGDVTKIPMTNTGRVRQYVRKACFGSGRKTVGQRGKYLKVMKALQLETDAYEQMKSGFMGGFTHANANYVDKTLENVTSIDFTSSYPSVMVSELFPMSKFRKSSVKTVDRLEVICEKYCVLFDAKFVNIRSTLSQEQYLSESKCYELKDPVTNNGRVVSAEELAITLTDVDFDIIKHTYEWDEMYLGDVRVANKGYLSKPIIESILNLYQGKTELKDVEGYETEYLNSKGMLNSIYGMSVTDIAKDQCIYTDEDDWNTEAVDLAEKIDGYNESLNRFLYYPWGLWITAYARRNLWTGILAVGDDYVYSDTDSLKLLNYEKYKGYIEWFDEQIIEKMHYMCEHYNIDKSLLAPKTKDGVEKMLGIWDYEGTYPKFKTLGAKRYMVIDRGRLVLTVAGLSKQNGAKYLLELANNDIDEAFNYFTDKLYIPADKTGKMTHTYVDEEMKYKITDYLGNEATVETLSGVHLENCDFTLSISDRFSDYLSKLSSGYFFGGLKHV